MSLQERINNKLENLSRKNQARNITLNYNKPILDLSSNDYLGLASNPESINKLNSLKRIGSSASRVLTQNLEKHLELENSLSEFTGFEACLLSGSGFLSNLGTLSSIIERQDIVLSDKLIHASLIDGIMLSKATHIRVPHNSLSKFEENLQIIADKKKQNSEIFIVTESVFSMDGDICPVEELYTLCEKYDATLILDEAHAIGVFGHKGEGIFSSLNLNKSNVIILGTLSKSLGSYGGFICCSKKIKNYLISKSRTFLYSTALPEIILEHALNNLELMKKNPGIGEKLLENSRLFSNELLNYGLNIKNTGSPIIPVIIGSEEKTLSISKELQQKGIFVPAIRPPTVPTNSSRLRCSVSLNCSKDRLRWGASEINKIIRQMP